MRPAAVSAPRPAAMTPRPAPQEVISLISELSALALLLCLEVMLRRSRMV